MSRPTLILALLTAASLSAAWDYSTLSGASHGAIASRTFGTTERSFIAYRDQSGSLAVTTLRNGTPFTTQTVWPGMAPTNTYINISPTNGVLITFWSANKFRFAMEVTAGNGNCGPTSNWRCGDLLLPTGVTSVPVERVVGAVDSISRAHFIYSIAGPSGKKLYYTTRTYSGIWMTPDNNQEFTSPNQSPTAFTLGTALYSSKFFTSIGNDARFVAGSFSGPPDYSYHWTDTLAGGGWKADYVDMDTAEDPTAFCVTSAVPNVAGSRKLYALRRTPPQFNMTGSYNLPYTGGVNPYTAGCSVRVRASGAPSIAYSDTSGIIQVTTATSASNWALAWNTNQVDGSAVFSKPQLAVSKNQKLYVLYQASGYLKFAREL
jgi:hypothetical protein